MVSPTFYTSLQVPLSEKLCFFWRKEINIEYLPHLFSTLFLCVCVCTHVHVCMHRHVCGNVVCMWVCMQAMTILDIVGLPLSISALLPWNRVSHSAGPSPCWLGWVVSRSLGIHLTLFTNAEVRGTLNLYIHAGDLNSVRGSYPVQSMNDNLLDFSLDGHKWWLRFLCEQASD